MSFNTLFESDEDEAARLAAPPVGSKPHALAALPVRTRSWPEKRLVMLPDLGDGIMMVVLPTRYHPGSTQPVGASRRHDGSWDCIVIQSNNPRYPVTGYNLSISHAEIRRGVIIEPAFTR